MTIIMKVSSSTVMITFLLLLITIWSYSSGLERWIWSQCCRTLIKVFCSTTCQRQRMGVNWQTCLLPLTSLHTLLIPLMLLYHVTQVFLHHYASISPSIQKHICYICSCHMLLYTINAMMQEFHSHAPDTYQCHKFFLCMTLPQQTLKKHCWDCLIIRIRSNIISRLGEIVMTKKK